jgi:hypothetical protein
MNPVDQIPTTSRPPAAPVGQPSAKDMVWEGELLNLLSPLEALRVRLDDACEHRQALVALDVLLAMTVQVHDFVRRHPEIEQEALARLQVETNDYLNSLRQLRGLLAPSALKTLLRLVGRRTHSGSTRGQLLEAVGKLVPLLRSWFDLFADCFGTARAAQGWISTQEVFLTDLQGLIDQIQP